MLSPNIYQPATPFGNVLPSYNTAGVGAQPNQESGQPFLGSFNYGGQGYYVDPTGYVYNHNAYNNYNTDPYGMLFNTGQMYGIGANGAQGQFLGNVTPGMMTWTDPNMRKISGSNAGFNPTPANSTPTSYNVMNPQPWEALTPGGPLVKPASQSQQYGLGGAPPPVTPTPPPVTPAATTPTDPTFAGGPEQGPGPTTNYPMNPLGDLLSYPTVAGQLGIVSQLLSQQGMLDTMQPLVQQALGSVGRSNLPSSSYTDKLMIDAAQNAQTQNMLNAAGILNAVGGNMPGLSSAYLQPYQDQLEAFLMSYL